VSDPLHVVLATGNAGKAREFDRLLEPALCVGALPGGVTLPAETGGTFYENARLKAEAVFVAIEGRSAVLADDSGLEVGALGGSPGLQSARFAGARATDSENVAKLLSEMKGRDDREARFVCSLVLLLPSESGCKETPREVAVEGHSEGSVTRAPRGADGFGYDPVFQPNGWEKTLAEATPTEKDQVSHRGAAARALLLALTGLRTAGEES
jgi:XTP/dITP diphosphohydrolase